MEQLSKGIPDPDTMVSLRQLEKMEYLHACVKEALRLAMPVPGRLPRVVPENGQPLIIDGKLIPPGTIIGASAYSVHMDESIWGPNAESFIPERWLGGDKTKEPDKCLLTFSKGARACIGINLAHAEVFYTLAYFFRRYDIQLKTEEIKVVDCFVWKPLEPGLLIDCKRRVD